MVRKKRYRERESGINSFNFQPSKLKTLLVYQNPSLEFRDCFLTGLCGAITSVPIETYKIYQNALVKRKLSNKSAMK